jgi:hypothetical protein
MAQSPLYNSSLVNLYRSIGNQMGVSPAFVNASIAQGISESSLDPKSRGDGGKAFGLHQWHPDRQRGLLTLSKQMGLPPTDPRVQIPFWYNENKSNWSISDPTAANNAAIASERPAGWKPGDPTGVPSYNKRLGDTMALMRMQAGQPNTQDPNSFMAMAPEGADGSPQATVGPQSVSLGDDQQQPFDNIGSTLANVGAAIASLDSQGTGIASLNASRVAQNLSAQEAMRERQGGWKFIGQTDNGLGMIFQKPTGEVRIEPVSGQFAGQKEPENIRTLRMLADPANKQLLDVKEKLSGNSEQSNFDENGNWKYETSVEDVDTLIDRAAAGEGNDVLKGQTKKTRADFNHRVTERNIAPETFAAGKAAQSGLLQQSREFGRRQGVLEIAVPKLQTDIAVARDLLQQYKKENPNSSWKGWNWLKNATTEEFTGPGAQTLAKLKETFKTLTDQFATVQQNGQLTEASRQQAAKLINENMDTGVAEAVLDNMQSLGVRSLDSVRKARENHLARMTKKPLPFPELEDDPEANKTKSNTKRLKYNPATGELE